MMRTIATSLLSGAAALAGLTAGCYLYKSYFAPPVEELNESKIVRSMLVTLRKEVDESEPMKKLLSERSGSVKERLEKAHEMRREYLDKMIKPLVARLCLVMEPLYRDDFRAYAAEQVTKEAGQELTSKAL